MTPIRMLAKQRGVAVVTALLLTTLAVTIVASLFWQQQVQVRSVENQRLHLQTRWILRGALDWARLILRQDGNDSPNFTREDGVWATPLAETRLDQYVEREQVRGEDYDATIQGQVYDAQSRYNLSNLAPGGVVNESEVRVFRQLLGHLRLDESLATAAGQQVALASKNTVAAPAQEGEQPVPPVQQQTQATGGSAPMPLQQVDDLVAAGFTAAAVERLRDYVIVLPPGVNVNVNTAKPEVLAALVEGMSLSQAQSLAAARKNKTWSKGEFEASPVLNGGKVLGATTVRSDYFLVLSQVKLDRAALESWALIFRAQPGGYSRTELKWIREI